MEKNNTEASFKDLKTPCINLSNIITLLRNSSNSSKPDSDDKKIEKFHRYIVIPNEPNGDLEKSCLTPISSRRQLIKKKNLFLFEEKENYPPKEYSLDARERLKNNKNCLLINFNLIYFEEYLNYKNNFFRKNITYKQFVMQNKHFMEMVCKTYNVEYPPSQDYKERHFCGIEWVINKRTKTYDDVKNFIHKTKEEFKKGYGTIIGTECEPLFKRYFSKKARGYYMYNNLAILFSVDGYDKDLIYELKTCKKDKIKSNLNFAKDQANLYAYIIGKKKIMIEIFSYEEDKIYNYEFAVDKKKVEEQLEKFYEQYKLYLNFLS